MAAEPARNLSQDMTPETTSHPQGEARKLTPDDLLALVRQSADRFQPRGVLPAGSDGAAEFRSRRLAEPMPEPVPAPEPVTDAAQADAPAEPPFPDTDAPAGAPEKETPAPEFHSAPAPQSIDLEAERQAAWDAGFAEATAQHEAAFEARLEAARAELQEVEAARISEARDAFAQTLDRLSTLTEDMLETVGQEVQRAIRSLAAERAGQRIDEAPKPFLRRIERMLRQVADAAAETVIHMNPADLLAIRPHVKEVSPLSAARLAPDPGLGRGDLRLTTGDTALSDVIAPRSGGGLA